MDPFVLYEAALAATTSSSRRPRCGVREEYEESEEEVETDVDNDESE